MAVVMPLTRPAPRARRGRAATSYALAAVVLCSGFLEPSVSGMTIGDAAALGLMAMMLVEVCLGGSRAAPYVRSLGLGAYLVALGSLVGALAVGLTGWILDDYIRDVAVAATFVAALEALERDRRGAVGLATAAFALGGTIVAFQVHLLPHEELRAQATFPNPNLAGHFLATVLIALWVLRLRWDLRLAVSAVLVVAILDTSSFGALVQIGASAAYLGFVRLRRATSGRPRLLVSLLGAGLVAGVFVLALATSALPDDTDTTALSEERLQRSGGERFGLWRQGVEVAVRYPLGAGPASTNGLQLLEGEQELHNEPLAYLAERSVIGLAGLIVVVAALWRLAPPAAGARALLVGFGVQSLLRETSHYRHLWLALAVVLVADRGAARRAAAVRV